MSLIRILFEKSCLFGGYTWHARWQGHSWMCSEGPCKGSNPPFLHTRSRCSRTWSSYPWYCKKPFGVRRTWSWPHARQALDPPCVISLSPKKAFWSRIAMNLLIGKNSQLCEVTEGRNRTVMLEQSWLCTLETTFYTHTQTHTDIQTYTLLQPDAHIMEEQNSNLRMVLTMYPGNSILYTHILAPRCPH